MMTEPHSPEPYPPPGEPVPCAWCGGPIVNTPLGWMHLDQYRALVGWLCPEPHMRLAEPRTGAAVERHEPAPPPATSSPRPRPTPIPPRKGAHQADSPPAEWPSPGNADWWENRH